jgi:hypothetical protein
MPFLTYKIKNEIFDNYKNLNIKNFNRFLNDIDDLNHSKKTILVDNKVSIFKKIKDIQKLVSKNAISDNSLQVFNALLVDSYRILNLSNKVEELNKIKVDFIKDEENEISENISRLERWFTRIFNKVKKFLKELNGLEGIPQT